MSKHKRALSAIALIAGIGIFSSIVPFTTDEVAQKELSNDSVGAYKNASSQATDNIAISRSESSTSLFGEGEPASQPDSSTMRKLKRDRLFDYSRSGNFEDTHSVLKNALNEKLISEDEYYGELAHMFHLPVAHSHAIISEIIKSENDYGFEVLVSSLDENYDIARSMTKSERQDILTQLYKNKPVMVSDMSLLGVGSVSKYTSWIGSLQAFSTEKVFIENLNDIIENKISDPREAFGLYDVIVKKGYSKKIDDSALRKYNYYIAAYKASYPENRMAELVSTGQW